MSRVPTSPSTIATEPNPNGGTGLPVPPFARLRPPADYPGCPVTVDIALASGRALRAPRWGIPDFLICLVGFVLLSIAAYLGCEALHLPPTPTLLISLTVPWLALAGWPALTTRLQGNGPRIDLGLRLTWTDLGWGILGGLSALLVGGLIALGLQAIFGNFSSAAMDVGNEIKDQGPPFAVILFAVCVAIGAPICEEIAFRGMGYASLAKRGLPPGWNIAITSVAFSLFHLEPTRIPILLATGAILGILRWRTRSLGASIVAHAVNNLAGAAFFVLG